MTDARLPVTIHAWGQDTPECACGNHASAAGFLTCTTDGRPVDPGPSEWDGIHLVCKDCGLIIDQTTYDAGASTMDVVGRSTYPLDVD